MNLTKIMRELAADTPTEIQEASNKALQVFTDEYGEDVGAYVFASSLYFSLVCHKDLEAAGAAMMMFRKSYVSALEKQN